MFLDKSRENKEWKHIILVIWNCVKYLKKSGQMKRKIIERHEMHAVRKRIALGVRMRKAVPYMSVFICVCIYACFSSYLTSKWTPNPYCVEIIYLLWDSWYSSMEKSWLLGYDIYYMKDGVIQGRQHVVSAL